MQTHTWSEKNESKSKFYSYNKYHSYNVYELSDNDTRIPKSLWHSKQKDENIYSHRGLHIRTYYSSTYCIVGPGHACPDFGEYPLLLFTESFSSSIKNWTQNEFFVTKGVCMCMCVRFLKWPNEYENLQIKEKTMHKTWTNLFAITHKRSNRKIL